MAYSGAPGERIAYHVFEGPPGAPPLLLIHGFTASSASFLSNIQGLRRHFTVIACELLGHGGSDAPEDPALYGPDYAVERIATLLDELDYDDVLICGHSLGGALALRFALDQPRRTAGIIVINSNSGAGTPEWRENAKVGLASMAESVREQGVASLRDSRIYPAASTRLPEDARNQLIRDFDRLTPEAVAGTAEALVADVNAWERLPELQVPVLIVIGDRDAAFVDSAPAFLERLPAEHTRWITIAGAGHAANLESPEEFNAIVARFAEELGYAKTRAGGAAFNRGLMALGGTLVIGGVGLLVAAFAMNGGGSSNGGLGAMSADDAAPTPVERVAGEQTPGSGESSFDSPADTETPTPESTGDDATVTPTAVEQTDDDTPGLPVVPTTDPTSTPPQATATPISATPQPTATVTTPEPTATVTTPAPEPTATTTPAPTSTPTPVNTPVPTSTPTEQAETPTATPTTETPAPDPDTPTPAPTAAQETPVSEESTATATAAADTPTTELPTATAAADTPTIEPPTATATTDEDTPTTEDPGSGTPPDSE